jgi:nucleoside-diphosphate-sugar epimerase
MGNNFGNDFKKAHPEEIGANGVIKVCIGGGAGFIGSHIAKRLMAEVKFNGTALNPAYCHQLSTFFSIAVIDVKLFSGLLCRLRGLERERVHEAGGILQ